MDQELERMERDYGLVSCLDRSASLASDQELSMWSTSSPSETFLKLISARISFWSMIVQEGLLGHAPLEESFRVSLNLGIAVLICFTT